ncbi:hypothetical protein Golob_026660 [Gossypium lobatum]|uniref:RNase H type-1 domain-containing protein n=1 Tax=Gossypium lobatum TaxID=34289 RepID=A0A7J8LW06_9ROSI|nr:hypothetical protein [Gossypium lobatum]
MITSIPNAFAAEALACVQAIQFGAESGYLRVDIEGDALSILRKLQDDLDNRSKIRAYILNVNRLKRNFINCKFKYASRIGNNVVRTLAKKGLRVGDDTYLNNGLSGAVLAAVAEDCRGLLRNRSVNGIESGKRAWPWLGCPEKQSFRKVGQSMGNDKESDLQVLVASCGFVLGFKEKCRIKIKIRTFRLIGPWAVLF